jgi:hypothetical protein
MKEINEISKHATAFALFTGSYGKTCLHTSETRKKLAKHIKATFPQCFRWLTKEEAYALKTDEICNHH